MSSESDGAETEFYIRPGEPGHNQNKEMVWARWQRKRTFVQDGHGRFIAQIGGKDTDVPQLKDLVTDPAGKALLAMLQSQGDIARLTAGPPGIPQDRLDALRTAYRQAMEDKELQAKAEKLERSVEPAYGDELLAMVKAALDQPPEIVELLKKTLDKPKTEGAAAPK